MVILAAYGNKMYIVCSNHNVKSYECSSQIMNHLTVSRFGHAWKCRLLCGIGGYFVVQWCAVVWWDGHLWCVIVSLLEHNHRTATETLRKGARLHLCWRHSYSGQSIPENGAIHAWGACIIFQHFIVSYIPFATRSLIHFLSHLSVCFVSLYLLQKESIYFPFSFIHMLSSL